MIKLTDTAISKIKEISEAEDIGHFNIRLKVIGGGCAGFSYDMYYDNFPSDMDEIFKFENVSIIIDPLSYQYLDEVEIDYVENQMGAGFKFLNPNVKGTCGCGSSFQA